MSKQMKTDIKKIIDGSIDKSHLAYRIEKYVSQTKKELMKKIKKMKVNKGKLGSPNPKYFTEVIKWPFWNDSLKKESNEMWQTAVSSRIIVERDQVIDEILQFLETESIQK